MDNVIVIEDWLFNKVECLRDAAASEFENGDGEVGLELVNLALTYQERLELLKDIV